MNLRISIEKIRSLLSDNRVFLMGPQMNGPEDIATSYPDHIVINIPEDINLEPYSTYWSGSGRSLVSMGAFSYTGSTLPANVSVGRYCSIAKGLTVMGNRHPLERISTSPAFYTRAVMMKSYEKDLNISSRYTPFSYTPGKITIGNDVWIGENVTLGHGISIGDGAVVASNAVVTKNVEPYTVVGGVPAKKIKYRFPIDVITDLRRSRWWEYGPETISKIDMTDPIVFSQRIGEVLASAEKFMPKVLTIDDFRKFQ